MGYDCYYPWARDRTLPATQLTRKQASLRMTGVIIDTMEMWGQGMLREAPETWLFVKVHKCNPGDSELFPFMILVFS